MAQGNKAFAPSLDGLLAELEAATRRPESALALIDQGLEIARETGEHLMDPYLYRLRGEILLRRGPDNLVPAEEAFQTAIAIAKQQGARSYGLLASLSLAKLYQSTGRPADAHAVLAQALEGFAPTPEMPEIAEAHALLAQLAEMEEVKAAMAQGERRLRLQTAYAQAVMWSKGVAADETKSAFERIGDLAAGGEFPDGRFPALYGQVFSSLTRGEIRTARDTAERFLREAEATGRIAEVGVGHRMLGSVCTYLGELAEARSQLEVGLNSHVRDRGSETSEKFVVQVE